MLGAISWGTYITVVIVLLGLWYGYLIFRFYSGKMKDFFRGTSNGDFFKKSAGNPNDPFAEFEAPFDTLEDAEELYRKIVKIFAESDNSAISRQEFLNYLRFVLEEYPFVKQSALRSKINSLIVLESQKYPVLLLKSEEADGLWEVEE